MARQRGDELAGWTVEQVLDRCPSCAMTFVRYRAACVGCVFARFCTIAEVAGAYGVPVGELTAALTAIGFVHEPPPPAAA